jgi:hypothetical protein
VRHPAERVERQRRDRRVGVRPRPPVERDDLLSRLVRGRPEVDVRVGLERGVVEPGRRIVERPVERRAEVGDLDPGQVLDQPEQVGAGRRARPPDFVLREPVELPDERRAASLEVAQQPGLRVTDQFFVADQVECSISSIV